MTKSFGGVTALDHVDLTILPGRGARLARRERVGQVDVDQGARRLPRARRRIPRGERPRCASAASGRRVPRSRLRVRAPGPRAHPDAERHGEPVPQVDSRPHEPRVHVVGAARPAGGGDIPALPVASRSPGTRTGRAGGRPGPARHRPSLGGSEGRVGRGTPADIARTRRTHRVPPASTRSRFSSISSAASRPAGRACCSSPTTSTRYSRSPTASRCFATATSPAG